MNGEEQRTNPYVGPRAFRKGEAFFGREREVRELFQLFVARRIVLLHSPSGAGKTSLVRAGLLPRLEKEGFRILPVARVNVEPPPGANGDDFNRYAYSVLLSLQEESQEESQRSDEALAGLTLTQYLEGLVDADEEGEVLVLVVDQFEELLTIAPTDIDQKHRFFAQLGAALSHPYVWSLLVIREDYLGALEPYVRAVPTRLANIYRLDLLGIDAASQAISEPAAGAGVNFTPEAVEKLVDDLRLIQVQQPDGSFKSEPGPYVEPVHLQVVCRRLWAALPAGTTAIVPDHVAAVGDVDQSLADYYCEHVRAIAAETGVPERDIRRWFHSRLVTREGIRVPVLMGSDESRDLLARGVIGRLVDAYLVRAEKRGGKTWLEMAHDRLVAPIRSDNIEWFEKNLHPMQRQAELWEEEKADYLLFHGETLQEAHEWAMQHHRQLSENDRAFLKASLKEEEQRGEEQKSRERQRELELEAATQRRQKRLLAGLLVLAAIAIVFAITIVNLQRRAGNLDRDVQVYALVATESARIIHQMASENSALAGGAGALADDPKTLAESTVAAATATAVMLQSELVLAEANATVRAGGSSGEVAEAALSALGGTATANATAAVVATLPAAEVLVTTLPPTTEVLTATPAAPRATATAIATGTTGQEATLPSEPLLFVSDRDGPDTIYRMNPADSMAIQLVSSPGYAWWPAWCGDSVVFEWGDDIWQPTSIEIARVAGDGSDTPSTLTSNRLPADSATNGSPSCSLDGRYVAFSSRSEGAAASDFKIGRIDLEAQERSFDLLGSGYSLGGHVGWSPDGGTVVFMHYISDERRFDIYRVRWDDPAQFENLTESLSASCKYPAWSPVDDRIAFACSSGDIRTWSLYVYEDGTVRQVLTDLHIGSERYEQRQTVRHAVTPTWSPDGQWIAFSSDMDGDWDVYAYALETGQLVNLTEEWSSSDEIHPWWSRR